MSDVIIKAKTKDGKGGYNEAQGIADVPADLAGKCEAYGEGLINEIANVAIETKLQNAVRNTIKSGDSDTARNHKAQTAIDNVKSCLDGSRKRTGIPKNIDSVKAALASNGVEWDTLDEATQTAFVKMYSKPSKTSPVEPASTNEATTATVDDVDSVDDSE